MKRPILLGLTGLVLGISVVLVDSRLLLPAVIFILLFSSLTFIRHKMYVYAILMSLFFAVGTFAARHTVNESHIIERFLYEPVTVWGEISERYAHKDGYVYKVKVTGYKTENKEAYEKINLRWICPQNLTVGSDIIISGKVYAHSRKMDPFDFDGYNYYKVRGYDYGLSGDEYTVTNIDYNIMSYITDIRDSMLDVYNKLFSEENAAVLRSVILGDKSSLMI